MTASAHDAPILRLREELARRGVDGFVVPRSDAFMGEYVPASDERLAWVCGFTGSAGTLVALAHKAALFVDGRYELQAADQVDPALVDVVAIREKKLTDWIAETLPEGATLAYDPWLHTTDDVERLEAAAKTAGAAVTALTGNPIDAIWTDRPAPPTAKAVPHPLAYAGEAAADKRKRLGDTLAKDGLAAAFIAAPESVCWLFNIRGNDVPRTPVVRARALLKSTGSATLFVEPEKIDDALREHLGPDVDIAAPDAIAETVAALSGGKVAIDRAGAPAATGVILKAAGAEAVWRQDVALRPKAVKNATELAGARAAQARDGAAIATALAWIDREAPAGGLDELTVSKKLAEIRRETAQRLGSTLEDLSFDAIVGFGPNGAIVHYRVDETSNREIQGDGLLLIDSGGQYRDGTTDITRTVAIGTPLAEAIRPYTLVLKGMIAISRLRFPEKIAGRDIEAFARAGLWRAGLDFDHGVGHGVGSYLSVHEGPTGLSRRSGAALDAGMILSNEPGYYKQGAFGIRIENLVIVTEAEAIDGGDRAMHGFETLTLAPIDRRLIDVGLLSADERAWLDDYHARVAEEIGPLVDDATRQWLVEACRAL